MTTPRPDSRLRAAIVDDEPLARDGLAAAIARLDASVDVVARYANGVVALDGIRHDCPDLLFLDISMPVLDGFAMLEQLEPEATPPAVVFVTAYDEHAVRAFETEATDFLVKPVSDDRSARRARARRRSGSPKNARIEASSTAPRTRRSSPQPIFDTIVIPERGNESWFRSTTSSGSRATRTMCAYMRTAACDCCAIVCRDSSRCSIPPGFVARIARRSCGSISFANCGRVAVLVLGAARDG